MTTYIIGQDGSCLRPGRRRDDRLHEALYRRLQRQPGRGLAYDWRTIDEYLARFDRTTALNVAYLIPNGNVRMEVMGLDPRPATDDEIWAMQAMVRAGDGRRRRRALDGLDYIPSRYADAREIAALCEAIVPDDGVYVTHMRGYGPKAADGMARGLRDRPGLGRRGAHVSHYNGPADLLLPLIDQGRALGLDLTFDTYPYLAGSTILGMVALPAVGPGGGDRRRRSAAWPTRPSAAG